MDWFYESGRNVLLYERTTDQIERFIPEARRIDPYIAVPRNLRNSQILRHLNYPVVPIIDGYDWPIEPGRAALPHQKLMANFQCLHPRCFNFSDPGTMKTLSTLWAADWLMRQYPKGECRVIIVCPMTIMETVWGAALFANFLDNRRYEILHGDADKRSKLLAKEADFYIVNFDGVRVGASIDKSVELRGFSKQLAGRRDIKICIVDEATGYSDASTARHRVARQVVGWREYLWQLTGTPTPNYPSDAYGLAKLCNNAYGKSFNAFRNEVEVKISLHKWVARRDGYDTAARYLTPAIRIPIEAVWHGPTCTTQTWEVELTDHQKKLMADLKRDLQIKIKEGTTITAVNEAALRTKFLQISLGAIYDADHEVHLADATPRMRDLEAIIKSTNRKVLIFCPLTSVIHLLYKRLSKKWGGAFVNGEIAQNKRRPIILDFANNPEKKWMLVDAQTTAHGINELVCCDITVWYGPTEKGELYTQGNRRMNRPGQEYPMTVYHMVSNQLEKDIFGRLVSRQGLQGVLLKWIEEDRL